MVRFHILAVLSPDPEAKKKIQNKKKKIQKKKKSRRKKKYRKKIYPEPEANTFRIGGGEVPYSGGAVPRARGQQVLLGVPGADEHFGVVAREGGGLVLSDLHATVLSFHRFHLSDLFMLKIIS